MSTYDSPWSEPMPKPADEMNAYVAIIPDLADSKRMEVRPMHLAGAAPGHESGWIVQGGATFTDDTKTKMSGSYMIIREVSIEAVKARLARDIYATAGAWELSKATIIPCINPKGH